MTRQNHESFHRAHFLCLFHSIAPNLMKLVYQKTNDIPSSLFRAFSCLSVVSFRYFIKNYRFVVLVLAVAVHVVRSCFLLCYMKLYRLCTADWKQLPILTKEKKNTRDTRFVSMVLNFLFNLIRSLFHVHARCYNVWRCYIKSHENQFTCKI